MSEFTALPATWHQPTCRSSHTCALSVHSTGELLHLGSVQGERPGQAWRKKQLLQLSWPSPSSSECSCEPEPKKPSKIKVPKRADAQKSSGDLSGVQTQRFSRGDDDQRSKCHHPGASPSWFSTDLLFDLGQVPCLLCQYFPSCPQEQNPYLIWCVKISAFRSLEIRWSTKTKGWWIKAIMGKYQLIKLSEWKYGPKTKSFCFKWKSYTSLR